MSLAFIGYRSVGIIFFVMDATTNRFRMVRNVYATVDVQTTSFVTRLLYSISISMQVFPSFSATIVSNMDYTLSYGQCTASGTEAKNTEVLKHKGPSFSILDVNLKPIKVMTIDKSIIPYSYTICQTTVDDSPWMVLLDTTKSGSTVNLHAWCGLVYCHKEFNKGDLTDGVVNNAWKVYHYRDSHFLLICTASSKDGQTAERILVLKLKVNPHTSSSESLTIVDTLLDLPIDLPSPVEVTLMCMLYPDNTLGLLVTGYGPISAEYNAPIGYTALTLRFTFKDTVSHEVVSREVRKSKFNAILLCGDEFGVAYHPGAKNEPSLLKLHVDDGDIILDLREPSVIHLYHAHLKNNKLTVIYEPEGRYDTIACIDSTKGVSPHDPRLNRRSYGFYLAGIVGMVLLVQMIVALYKHYKWIRRNSATNLEVE